MSWVWHYTNELGNLPCMVIIDRQSKGRLSSAGLDGALMCWHLLFPNRSNSVPLPGPWFPGPSLCHPRARKLWQGDPVIQSACQSGTLTLIELKALLYYWDPKRVSVRNEVLWEWPVSGMGSVYLYWKHYYHPSKGDSQTRQTSPLLWFHQGHFPRPGLWDPQAITELSRLRMADWPGTCRESQEQGQDHKAKTEKVQNHSEGIRQELKIWGNLWKKKHWSRAREIIRSQSLRGGASMLFQRFWLMTKNTLWSPRAFF